MSRRVFRAAGWYTILAAISCILIVAAGAYFAGPAHPVLYRIGGVGAIAFGLLAFIDVLVSRIVLDDDAIRIISLVRRRAHARNDFESAKVDGGAVCLKKRDGSWLILPSTGHNALSVRNTIDAWIKSK